MKANNKRKVFGDAVDLLMDGIEEREVPRGIQLIQIKNIQPFHDHPFHLYEGERLEDMIASLHWKACQRFWNIYQVIQSHRTQWQNQVLYSASY